MSGARLKRLQVQVEQDAGQYCRPDHGHCAGRTLRVADFRCRTPCGRHADDLKPELNLSYRSSGFMASGPNSTAYSLFSVETVPASI